jgi:dynein heavy chain
MQTSANVGIILIDSLMLKEFLSPSPKKSLQDIEKLLPELAKLKNEELLSDLNNATRTLTSTPKTVEEFVEYLAFLQSTIDGQDEMTARFNGVTEMYQMMDDYQVKKKKKSVVCGGVLRRSQKVFAVVQVSVPEEEYALYQTLKPAFDKLKEVIATSESTREESQLKFFSLFFFFFLVLTPVLFF